MKSNSSASDFLVVGAGIFGLFTSIALRNKGFSVLLINPGTIPHPQAASTDISKIIRMEYGTDEEYMDMAIASMLKWREWNEILEEIIFEEVGFLVLSVGNIDDLSSYEGASYRNLLKRGKKPQRLTSKDIVNKFPSFSTGKYVDGFYHSEGGYGHSGRAIILLKRYAEKIGVVVKEGVTATDLLIQGQNVVGIRTVESGDIETGHTVLCSGNSTPYLCEDLMPFMKITGHPVFHIKPSKPALYDIPFSAPFAADISGSGWYGFSLHPREGVVKIGNHSKGLLLNPFTDPREVLDSDIKKLRSFLKQSIPSLCDDPIVYTRICCYTDTLDGHFWIDNHPVLRHLTIGSGGSGHGFKMGPEVGEMIALTAMNEKHRWSNRYQWRDLDDNTMQKEEARHQ